MDETKYTVTIIANGSFIIQNERGKFIANWIKPDSDSVMQLVHALEGIGWHKQYKVISYDVDMLIKHVLEEAVKFSKEGEHC